MLRAEYPRPQFVRNSWLNLNGEWEFEIDNSVSGKERELYKTTKLKDKILVPFCPESKLSGVGNTDFMNCVWYRKEVNFSEEWLRDVRENGDRIVLHFGAVDYKATIYVNEKEVGAHTGGYSSFAMDITEYIDVASKNVIVVCAEDDVRSKKQPAGKQSAKYEWDMRALEFGTNMDLHGIQCAIGTLISAKLYEQIKELTPNKEKALAYVNAFEYSEWSATLKEFLGKSSEAMIALEAKEHKYDAELHRTRLELITEKWDEILAIVEEELPSSAQIEKIMEKIEAPKTPEEFGLGDTCLVTTFKATKDIRDKYVLSRLAWDLGVIDELAFD